MLSTSSEQSESQSQLQSQSPGRLGLPSSFSRFPHLSSQLQALILSYDVGTTRDLARLRRISRRVCRDVIPLLPTAVGSSPILCSYGNIVDRTALGPNRYMNFHGTRDFVCPPSPLGKHADHKEVPFIKRIAEAGTYMHRHTHGGDSREYEKIWAEHQQRAVTEGVAVVDGIVPSSLHQALRREIDRLARTGNVDYHPFSDEIVRDIVHPALYPFIRGVTSEPTKANVGEILPCSFPPINYFDDSEVYRPPSPNHHANGAVIPTDFWGRKYEDSVYQWLPTYFDVGSDGRVSICDYINNLVPRSKHHALYGALQELFSQALPFLESVYSYVRAVRARIIPDSDGSSQMQDSDLHNETVPLVPELSALEVQHCSLRGVRLQVITKIVDYELRPGQKYEGAWHFEGMSHEEIVATALYILDRDEAIVGGDLLFQRAYQRQESAWIWQNLYQDRDPYLDLLVSHGLMPLGKVSTLPGRLIVFPNSHVHRVQEMKNLDDWDIADRPRDPPSIRRVLQSGIREWYSEEDEDYSDEEYFSSSDEDYIDENVSGDESSSSESSGREGDTGSCTISWPEDMAMLKDDPPSKRRIIVFFLVNPEKRIVSTREVAPQQPEAGGTMSLEGARKHRLSLMKERKYSKQDWNIRPIELCEH